MSSDPTEKNVYPNQKTDLEVQLLEEDFVLTPLHERNELPSTLLKETLENANLNNQAVTMDLEGGISLPPKEENGESKSQQNENMESSELRKKLLLYAKTAKPYVIRFLILFSLFLLGFFLFLGYDIYTNNFKNIPTSTYYNQGDVPSYRLTFIGDSLIHRPFKEFDLGGRLQRQFKTINLNITENAESGQIISECYDNIETDLPKGSADMVILYWDTDVSDYYEGDMSLEEVTLKRESYKSNLTAVINYVKAAGVSKMAVAGPTILGEGPFLYKQFMAARKNKKSMLNDYRQMNMDIAEELGVDYIDMRKSYLYELPDYWIAAAYYLTLDGEHPNDRGTGVIVDKFAKQISEWTGAPVK
eukprot:gene4951-5311_t